MKRRTLLQVGGAAGTIRGFLPSLEHFLRAGAKLRIDLAENQNRPDISSIPDGFPLSKKALTPHSARYGN